MSTKITLETSDKESFSVDKEVAERSVMLKNMLEGAFCLIPLSSAGRAGGHSFALGGRSC